MAEGLQQFIVTPTESVGGRLRVPGDKSISHRAVMLAGIAEGSSTVRGFLEGDDCLATLAAFEALGVQIERSAPGELVIAGRGMAGLTPPPGPLDLGNSGTAMRLLAGLLAASRFDVELTGDASLRARPMQRIATPLELMGARLQTRNGQAPLRIHGGATLRGIDYALPIASAQVKSAVLLAGLAAQGRTTVRSPHPTRDHTERMLKAMGAPLQVDGSAVSILGPCALEPLDIEIPGDFSSAAFFVVAACLAADHDLVIERVGVNPTRTGLLDMLRAMGASIELREQRQFGDEPVADLHIQRSELQGIEVPPELVPLAIDEFPAFFIAAAGARGRTVVRGAEELRHKESDRIASMARALAALGAAVEELPDGLVIQGGQLHGGAVDAAGDHRIAMACTMAGLISDAPIQVNDTALVATSFPNFAGLAAEVGLLIRTARPA